MRLDAEVFMALLRRLLPHVHKHLQQVGVGPLLYLPEWFLCLFARSLPFPTVLRVWDAFLSEGEWGSQWLGQEPWGVGGEVAHQLQGSLFEPQITGLGVPKVMAWCLALHHPSPSPRHRLVQSWAREASRKCGPRCWRERPRHLLHHLWDPW